MSNSNTRTFNEASTGYGWGPTDDGKGLVVWKGDWHEILPADSVLQFTDGVGTLAECGACEFTPNPVHGGGKIWGDPHFVGADGGKFDVHGENGNYYNILSDSGLQVNAKFASWGTKGATIMSEYGLVVDGEAIAFNRKGQLYVDGQTTSKDGSYLDGSVVKKGDTLTVTTDEYELVMFTKSHSTGDYLNIDFKSDNVAADGIMPHGIWGQTADGDGVARNGDISAKAQGGGAIEDANGDITAKGDVQTFKIYEVDGLFDTTFTHHNNYHDGAQANTNGVVDAGGEAGEPTEEGATATNEAAFKIVGNSDDYGWGPTEDGKGIVVWKGEWFKILEAGTKLQFDDQLVSTDAATQTGPMTVQDIANETQYLVGSEGNDKFVIDGKASDYDWGKTEDGEGIVVWSDNSVDLLYDFEQIEFNNNEIISLELMA